MLHIPIREVAEALAVSSLPRRVQLSRAKLRAVDRSSTLKRLAPLSHRAGPTESLTAIAATAESQLLTTPIA